MSDAGAVAPAGADSGAGASVAPAAPRFAPTTVAWFVALLGWSAFLSFYHLDGGADFELTDCWVAQTAREMAGGGAWRDLLVPRFSGETRIQKSPGPYWAVMFAAWARGTPVDETAARLPNAFAAVLLAATIFWLAWHIGGERAAVCSGFAAASSVFLLYWSHRGASDLGLAALTTLALACFWVAGERLVPGRRRAAVWLLGYFAAGVGMLYKLPMPLVCVGLPALLYVLLTNRWRLLLNRVHLIGLALFLLPWLPWALMVLQIEPRGFDKWMVEFVDRYTGDAPNAEHQGWKWSAYYLLPMVLYCLPWSLSLPAALWRGFRRQPGVERRGQWFLLIWVLSLLAFFTSSGGKEMRYFLPVVPPLLILLGVELAALFDSRRAARPARDLLIARVVTVAVPAVFVGIGFGLFRWWKERGQLDGFAWYDVWAAYLPAGAAFVLGAVAAGWLYARRREHAAFGALVAGMCGLWLWAWPQLMPIVANQNAARDFARQLRERVPPSLQSDMAQMGFQDSRVVWYSDYRWKRVIDQLELLDRQGGRRSREVEERLIGEEVIARLNAPRLALFVAPRYEFVLFLERVPQALAQAGRPLPPLHIWLISQRGVRADETILFGNRAPDWPAPKYEPSRDRPSTWPGFESGGAAAPATSTAPAP